MMRALLAVVAFISGFTVTACVVFAALLVIEPFGYQDNVASEFLVAFLIGMTTAGLAVFGATAWAEGRSRQQVKRAVWLISGGLVLFLLATMVFSDIATTLIANKYKTGLAMLIGSLIALPCAFGAAWVFAKPAPEERSA
jgi:hypothetical protein